MYYGAGVILYRYVDNSLQVLLLKRRGGFLGGTWGIPGGGYEGRDGIEDGKRNLKRSAIREAWEETSVRLVPDKVWYISTQKLPGYCYGLYAAELSSEVRPIKNSESSDIEWFPADKLPEGASLVTTYEISRFRSALKRKEK